MLQWQVTREPTDSELNIVSDGVLRHGRALAADGHAMPIACLLRENGVVVAGACGRTEYSRLFVQYLWVAPAFRAQGVGTQTLARLEDAATREGCSDSLIETLDDRVALLYERQGYRRLAYIARYVGPFNRHILLKQLSAAQSGA